MQCCAPKSVVAHTYNFLQHLNDSRCDLCKTKLDYHLINHVPSFKTKLKLFQQLTGPGIFNSLCCFPIKGAEKPGIDTQSYNDFRGSSPFVQLLFSRFWTVRTTNANFFRSFCLFQLTKFHQITCWSFLISSHIWCNACCFQRKKLWWTLTSLAFRDIILLIWWTMCLFTQARLEAHLEAQQMLHTEKTRMESISVMVRYITLCVNARVFAAALIVYEYELSGHMNYPDI